MYSIKLRKSFGDSNALTTTFKASFSKTSFSIAVNGGKVMLTGVGLPEEWPHALFKTSLTTDVNYEVLSSSATLMLA